MDNRYLYQPALSPYATVPIPPPSQGKYRYCI